MKYEGKYLTIQKQDWYIEGWYKEGVSKIDVDMAKCIVEERLRFQKGKDYPHLIHMKGNSSTKEARYYMKHEGIVGIKAGAFLVEDVFTKSILNFFITVLNPKVPAKLFTSRDEAIKWLKQFRD